MPEYISTMCGTKTSNNSVDPRVRYVNNGGAEVLVSISSKNRMIIIHEV